MPIISYNIKLFLHLLKFLSPVRFQDKSIKRVYYLYFRALIIFDCWCCCKRDSFFTAACFVFEWKTSVFVLLTFLFDFLCFVWTNLYLQRTQRWAYDEKLTTTCIIQVITEIKLMMLLFGWLSLSLDKHSNPLNNWNLSLFFIFGVICLIC